jgi:site-specific recombinase XerD
VRPGPGDGRELGAVIAQFLRAAEAGRVRRADGARYGREDLRALRGALSYVASELGPRPAGTIRAWQIESLLDRLRDAGLSPQRRAAVVDALRSLFAYAIGRGLLTASPVVGLALPEDDLDVPIRRNGTRVRETPTPTGAMLLLGEQVAKRTIGVIVVAFVLLAVALLAALA